MNRLKAKLRFLLLLTSLSALISLWVLYKRVIISKPVTIIDNLAIVREAYFPHLSSRLRFGALDIWRNTSFDATIVSIDVFDPSAERTFYMLKTEADVMLERLPIHLKTTLGSYFL